MPDTQLKDKKKHIFKIEGDLIIDGGSRVKHNRYENWSSEFDYDGDYLHRRWLEQVRTDREEKEPAKPVATPVNINGVQTSGFDPKINDEVLAFSSVLGSYVKGTIIRISKNYASTTTYTVRPYGSIYKDITVFLSDLKSSEKS